MLFRSSQRSLPLRSTFNSPMRLRATLSPLGTAVAALCCCCCMAEALMLPPEMTVPATPATLILPTGWYQPGRFVELFGEQRQVAKLLNVIEKGSDVDRCTVSLV